MKNLKPFDLQAALEGKAVMLRDGRKAYVRHYETEATVGDDCEILGYTEHGNAWAWRADGISNASGFKSRHDIIGMYPETRVINGFEVPVPETEELEYVASYYKVSLEGRHFRTRETWGDHDMDKRWLERGLVFLNEEDAIANAKAMLGIDPYSKGEDE